MDKPYGSKKMFLLAKIMWLDVLVVGVMIILSIGLAARYSMGLLERSLEQNLHNIAQLLATSKSVIEAFRKGQVSEDLKAYLDSALADQNGVDVITLADMRSIRLYHPNPERVGQRFFGGDEGPALSGQHYPSKAIGTLGRQFRYFHPVFDQDGRQLGFIHVSMMMSNLEHSKEELIKVHLQTLALVFVIGAVAAGFITINIKRSLLGFEPDQLAAFFMRRGEVMDSLEEGLIAVDALGSVILLNLAASNMLNLDASTILGRDIDYNFPQFKLKETLLGIKDYHNNILINDKNIMYDRVPIKKGKNIIGAMVILRDHSEVTRLAEQLTGSAHVLEALRANTHEFMNQLHVILGLVQDENFEEAKRFITSIGQIQNATVSTVFRSINNRVLGALILGKINKCHELGIKMHVLPHSVIPSHSRFLSTKSLITVVGNLVENSIEAITEKSQTADDEITLLIYEDQQSLMIMVDDTGIGLTAAEIKLMNKRGYTTKGSGRGTGLSLIRNIVEAAKGEATLESEKGVGTSQTLIFKKPRLERGVSSQSPIDQLPLNDLPINSG
jgi:sensor histidine kinase regulating citrate/malate metabolism